jgi:hypothetical protein
MLNGGGLAIHAALFIHHPSLLGAAGENMPGLATPCFAKQDPEKH